jgi:hypothetical protein
VREAAYKARVFYFLSSLHLKSNHSTFVWCFWVGLITGAAGLRLSHHPRGRRRIHPPCKTVLPFFTQRHMVWCLTALLKLWKDSVFSPYATTTASTSPSTARKISPYNTRSPHTATHQHGLTHTNTAKADARASRFESTRTAE